MRGALVSFLIFSVACGSDATRIDGPPPTPLDPDLAAINVRLRVTGDSTLLSIGSGIYRVTLDSTLTLSIDAKNPIPFRLPAGNHSFRFTRSFAGSSTLLARILGAPRPVPPWCNTVPPLTVDSVFPRRSTTDIEFIVDCPPLEGTATLHVTLHASGDNAPASAQVLLLSQGGPVSLTTITVPTNKDTELSIRTGIYRFGVDAPGCQISGGPYQALSAPLYLRRDTVVNVTLSLPCR